MSVVLLILKIIGIILAVIIGLILAAVLLVVFVPLRYKMNASVDEGFEGGAKVTWLLHLISAAFIFRDKELSYAVRVLGIKLLSSDKKEKPDKESKKAEKPARKKAESLKTEPPKIEPSKAELPEPEIPEKDPEMQDPVKVSEPERPVAQLRREEAKKISSKKTELPVKEKPPAKEITPVEEATSDEEKPRKGIVVRFFEKLQELYGKAYDALHNLKCTFERFCDKLNSTREKVEEVLDLASNDRTKSALSHIMKELKLILKRVLPRRWDLSMLFGMEDPSLTGKILGALSVIYPFFPGKMEIEPDFSKQIIKGHTELKGHIRAAAFIGPAIRLLFDKNIRYVYKTWRSR